MKIFNKFIWSKKEPSNKNDIWFDGSTWRMYTEEAWQSFTLPVDAADTLTKMLENASEVYQEKLNAGYGIVIEGNTISLDVSSIDINTTYNIGSIQLFDDIISSQNTYYLTTEDIEAIKGGKLITTTYGDMTIPAFGVSGSGTIIHMYFYVESKLYDIGIVDDGVTPCIFPYFCRKRDILLYRDDFLSETSENSVQNKIITTELNKKLNKTDVATINGQSLTEGGNIVIPTGEKYDDTEIKQQITELSEELASNGQLIEDLQNMKIDRENDDYYPRMAVGLADNLAGVDVVDSEINFRRSGGGAISDGVARIETIKGNSVVWNQVFKANESVSSGFMQLDGDTMVITSKAADGVNWGVISSKAQYVIGHKYRIAYEVISGDLAQGRNYFQIGGLVTTQPNTDNIVTSSSLEGKQTVALRVTPESVGARFKIKITDLTKMFGAGNEPATIEEFYARKPMGVDLNAYNEGEVIHMDVQSIESVGVNQWDEEWEKGSIDTNTGANVNKSDIIRTKNFIPVIEGRKYYYKCPSSGTAWSFCYDDKYNVVEKYLSNNRTGLASTLYNAEFTVPQGVHYIRFYVVNTYGATYKGDLCINLSDTSINGKYYPHIKRQEDLSLVRKYFPQGMKSAGTAHDEIRYNKASGKWEKVQRIGEVDMGTLTYHRTEIKNTNETYYVIYTYGLKDIVKLPSYRDIANVLTQGYLTKPTLSLFDYILAEKTIMLYGDGTLYIRDDAYTNVESFKAAMAGVMLYYELAEPIITELDEADQFRDLDYAVWNAGTEKAIAEGKSAPLAADITYGFNAIGKIKELESLVAALRAKVGI